MKKLIFSFIFIFLISLVFLPLAALLGIVLLIITIVKKNGLKKIIIVNFISIIIIVLGSYVNMQLYFRNEPIIHTYSYISSDGGFKDFECPEKGKDFNSVLTSFAEYKNKKNNDENIFLKRMFKKNWKKIYLWSNYILHKRWYLDYQETK